MKSDSVGLNLPRAKGAYRVRSTYRSPLANIESEGHIDALCRRKAQLSLPQVASEVIFDSEVHYVSEVHFVSVRSVATE